MFSAPVPDTKLTLLLRHLCGFEGGDIELGLDPQQMGCQTILDDAQIACFGIGARNIDTMIGQGFGHVLLNHEDHEIHERISEAQKTSRSSCTSW